jgi:hypothetical protein
MVMVFAPGLVPGGLTHLGDFKNLWLRHIARRKWVYPGGVMRAPQERVLAALQAAEKLCCEMKEIFALQERVSACEATIHLIHKDRPSRRPRRCLPSAR